MSDDLLAQLRTDLSRTRAEAEKLEAMIARIEGKEESEGRLSTPLSSFLAEDNLNWEWLFGGVIPTGATCIFAGEGKVAGKTTMLIQMSLCLAAGRDPFYDCRVPRAAKTLYVAAEGARAALQNRIKTAVKSLGIDARAASGLWFIQKKETSDYMLGSRGLERMIGESGAQLVILDTIGYFMRGNESDNTDWKTHVMHPARRLTAKYGCTFIFVDHQSKPSAERKGVHKVRGASAKKDDCDVVLQLEPVPGEEESNKRTLWLSATKYAATRRWDLTFDAEKARFG